MSQRSTEYRDELATLMLRLTAGKSYRHIARDARVSPSTIGNMVLGRVPSQQVCIAVANAMSVESRLILDAAGLPVPDAMEAIDLALRGVDDIPAEGKLQIKEFVQSIRQKYASVPDTKPGEITVKFSNGEEVVLPVEQEEAKG